MRIALDIDGVIADLHTEWYRRYNRDYHDTLTSARVTAWETHLFVKDECGKKIYDYLADPDLYANVEPIEGAIEGVNILWELGYEILFTTACGAGGVMIDQKCEWLYKHRFTSRAWPGQKVPPDLVVVEDKLWIDADIIIDDRGETVDRWVEQKRKPAVLFEYPHNRWLLEAKHSAFWMYCKRVDNWKQIVRYMRERMGV